MALGTLTLYGNTDVSARTGPTRTADGLIVERWKYLNTDSTRTNDKITCKSITKIRYARGANDEATGATDPFTIDNTVFPPTVTLNYIAGAGESGEVDIYGI